MDENDVSNRSIDTLWLRNRPRGKKSLKGLMAGLLVAVIACGLTACQNVGQSIRPHALPDSQSPAAPLIKKRVVSTEDGRSLEIEQIVPVKAPRGLIIFSHGANSSPQRYRRLTLAWAESGYVVASPLHLDSEEHPLRVTSDPARVLATRMSDWQAVVDDARRPEVETGLPPNLPIFAAGHSYGAYIAQIAGGATVINPVERKPQGLPLANGLKAVIALSPPPAFDGFSPQGSWRAMKTPMLVQTGSLDILPPFVTQWQQHLDSCKDAPSGLAWCATYDGVDHYFGGIIGRIKADHSTEDANQFARFVKLSLAFVEKADRISRSGFAREIDKYSDVLQ